MARILRVTDKSLAGIDLYEAASADDIEMMESALRGGQLLTQQRPSDRMTPVHVAAQSGSLRFIERAMQVAPETVWLRDKNDMRPYEHAFERRDQHSVSLFKNVMYPEVAPSTPSKE